MDIITEMKLSNKKPIPRILWARSMLEVYKACAIRIKASPNEIPKVRGYDNLFKTPCYK